GKAGYVFISEKSEITCRVYVMKKGSNMDILNLSRKLYIVYIKVLLIGGIDDENRSLVGFWMSLLCDW
ncbi:hypothetical protein, partial [Paenibacillus germinis]|uniref:hypothetical protein n=1 Tax=Paenibacillus germinis TaxID=2654979 RepID=UPI001C0F5A74